MTISVVIATYGSDEWRDLARRAAASVDAQVESPLETIVLHDDRETATIASVRNSAAAKAEGDWLCFLDGDDELDPGYIAAMQDAIETDDRHASAAAGTVDWLFTPKVAYVGQRGRSQRPKFWPVKSLTDGNWLVIGTLIPWTLFQQVGGFRDEAHGYEDWSLFARCWKAGAEIVKVPDAVYRAHVRGGSRNRSMTRRQQIEQHYAIGSDLFPEIYDAAWLERNLTRLPRERSLRHGRPRGR